MKARSVKYFLITLFLVVLIGVYVGANFIFANLTSGNSDANLSNPMDEVIPEPPLLNSTLYEPAVDLPTDPIDIINYALDIYNNGKGSSSTYTLDVYCDGEVTFGPLSANCKLNQHAVGNLYRNGKESFEEEYFYYDGVSPSSVAGYSIEGALVQYNGVKVGYRAINVEPEANKVTSVETKVADRSSQTYDLSHSSAQKSSYNLESGRERYVWIFSDDFPLVINSQTVQLKKFDKNTKKSYYTITVDYKLTNDNPKAVLPEKYSNYYKANSALEKVNYSKYSLTFQIDKKTGKLLQFVRDEEFTSLKNITSASLKMNINAKARFRQVFDSMDEAANIEKPYLNFKK